MLVTENYITAIHSVNILSKGVDKILDKFNNNKLLFICASPGSGGYRLGRLVSCLNNVHWYSHSLNGIYPWDVTYNNIVLGKNISPYHFDRYIDQSTVPLIGERIERYWHESDYDYFYNHLWLAQMVKCGANDVMQTGNYISWIVHDLPSTLLSRFPNAKILNLLDDDLDQLVDRYKTTTALFPAHIKSTSLKPIYKNNFTVSIESLMAVNSDPTYRDYWAWTKFQLPIYEDQLETDYNQYLYATLAKSVEHKKRETQCLNLSWANLDIDVIMKYLNSSTVDYNYLALTNPTNF